LKFGCIAVGLFFGLDTVWQELPNESSKKLLAKVRQDKYWRVKAYGEQNYRDDESFG
jgi:hypothetical protein